MRRASRSIINRNARIEETDGFMAHPFFLLVCASLRYTHSSKSSSLVRLFVFPIKKNERTKENREYQEDQRDLREVAINRNVRVIEIKETEEKSLSTGMSEPSLWSLWSLLSLWSLKSLSLSAGHSEKKLTHNKIATAALS